MRVHHPVRLRRAGRDPCEIVRGRASVYARTALTSTQVFVLGETTPILLTFVAYLSWHFGRLLPDEPNAEWKAQLAAATHPSAEGGSGEVRMWPVAAAGSVLPATASPASSV